MDFFGGAFVIEPTKQIIDAGCKILVWWSCSLGAMPAHLTDYDFAAITEEIYSDENRREGRTKDEILEQVSSYMSLL
jgi:hypothetical protein